ncbi:MAG: 1-(5-phosphoribosyl)-5-amino-4-imidazole-carboxylate carboxylase, partial [Desulfobacterales bacterium]|nr:1-(5-phosphoribosyl)-5-amino-4-imidazole-carboxylate carboxylase [Desulfobacterales bacterium]
MNKEYLEKILKGVSAGSISVEDAVKSLKHIHLEDIDYAHVDHHRSMRKGFPEVIFGEGKTSEQITG